LLNLFYPLPNASGSNNYVFSPNSASGWREDLVRVDQQLTDKVLLTVRYAHDNWYENENIFAPSNASFPTQPGFLGKPGYNAIIRLNWTINPTTTNVFTDSYSRNQIITYPTGAAASRAGINIPEVLPGNLFNAPPDVTISGYSNIGVGAPNPNVNNVFEWKDDLSHIVGSHTLQAGVDILRLQKFDRGAVNTQGAFTFNGNFTGNAAADFLLGDAFSYTESSLNPRILLLQFLRSLLPRRLESEFSPDAQLRSSLDHVQSRAHRLREVQQHFRLQSLPLQCYPGTRSTGQRPDRQWHGQSAEWNLHAHQPAGLESPAQSAETSLQLARTAHRLRLDAHSGRQNSTSGRLRHLLPLGQ
jgi:hypothetical protein